MLLYHAGYASSVPWIGVTGLASARDAARVVVLSVSFARSKGAGAALSTFCRRSRHIVQDGPLRSVWADIPGLSARDRRLPAAWQQYRGCRPPRPCRTLGTKGPRCPEV